MEGNAGVRGLLGAIVPQMEGHHNWIKWTLLTHGRWISGQACSARSQRLTLSPQGFRMH